MKTFVRQKRYQRKLNSAIFKPLALLGSSISVFILLANTGHTAEPKSVDGNVYIYNLLMGKEGVNNLKYL
jgi:hypothetical protein